MNVSIQNQVRCLLLLHSCKSMHHLLQIQAQCYCSHIHHDPFAASITVQVCCVVRNLGYARKVFDQIPHPNIFTWNTIIRAYSSSPSPDTSIHLFRRMLASSSSIRRYPNAYTFTFVIKACAKWDGGRELGQSLHGFIVKSGGDSEVCTKNGLIYMYVSFGQIDTARVLFDSCCERDHVSWNAMVSGYANCGMVDCARELFDQMPERGIVSWNAMLSGYAKCGRIDEAREIFYGMPKRNVESWNAMISGYVRCGCIELARSLFDEMSSHDVVSWSTMISAYVQEGHSKEALLLFDDMKIAGVKPNCATIVNVLTACTQLGSLEQGRRIHMQIEKNRLGMNPVLGTALVDIYAKCGCIDNAFRMFEQIDQKDVYVWTAMILGFGVNGKCDKALEVFALMEVARVRPNKITFLGVLTACNHGGLVEKWQQYFNMMSKIYSIQPQIEHYGCLIDALGRAGRFEEVVSVLQSMPMKPNSVVWGALLGFSWIHGHEKIAKVAGRRLVELDQNDGGVYALLSNIYTMSKNWDELDLGCKVS